MRRLLKVAVVCAVGALFDSPAWSQSRGSVPRAGRPTITLGGSKTPPTPRPTPWLSPVRVGRSAATAPSPASPRVIPERQPVGAGLPRPENLLTFDPLRVELKRADRRWVLEVGGRVLKDFGPRDQEARQALRLIRELRLNQRGTIGAPQPVMEYWLSSGRAPYAVPQSVRTLPVDLTNLRVEQSEGFWVLREPTRVLFNFGPHEREARQALAVMQKYGFNRVGIIGQAMPSMLVFASIAGETRQPLLADGHRSLESVMRAGARREESPRGAARPDSLPPARVKKPPASVYPTPVVPPLRPDSTPARGNWVTDRMFRRPDTLDAAPAAQRRTMRAVEDRLVIDARQLHVRRDKGEWKLLAGEHVLANFGLSERDARTAHGALVYYRMTEQRVVGGAEPVASYFLSSGHAPRGIMPGLLTERFRPESLSVRQYGNHYYLARGNHPLIDCGSKVENAEHLLAVIRHHGFDHLCRIGQQGDRCLKFFVRGY